MEVQVPLFLTCDMQRTDKCISNRMHFRQDMFVISVYCFYIYIYIHIYIYIYIYIYTYIEK